ncbi:MAG: hypothetical protein H0A75_00240 [Candidatus Methanofishera endochildressiae]|uniref:DNA binding HTH domain-containing protein n=1 Tax=Candidatus Methanofishera endochildressiae TaxID=2738884 RepID=A0A7Z0SD70_9GAMM|nr:hypothetical protein [Candidatus Methanofishera endochildressiae]
MADKKGAPRPKISRETIMRALKKTGYNQTYAAKELGKSRSWLKVKLSEDTQLRQMFDDARELVLDKAESQLEILVEKGDFNAIKFALSTRGRGRGFGTSIEVTGDSAKPIKIKATMSVEESARLYAEMKRSKMSEWEPDYAAVYANRGRLLTELEQTQRWLLTQKTITALTRSNS